LSGSKTADVAYRDHMIPNMLGKKTELPAVSEVLKLKGDAAQGKSQFGRCIMCHKVKGVGVDFGPDLTDWGKGQPRDVIAKAILEPSADISHGFEAIEIKTGNGKTIQGFPVAEGDPVIVRAFGGETVAIDRKDIASRSKMKKSVMVSAADMGLSAQNVRDLVEYLKTVR
ncbi:MAG: c-type cytochrome, partial [Verrucomicrobiota bacterium]